MNVNETFHEIQSITIKLIELGLCVQQNFPFRSGNAIFCTIGADTAKLLKNVSYAEKYEILNKDRNFNFKLIDGALIQLMYGFGSSGKVMSSHRLVFFPAPHLKDYAQDANAYELDNLGNSEYADMVEENVVKTPVRFDFNDDDKIFVNIHHPYAHMHLGEYESCRIPVSRPIPPSAFINFILRNFYNVALRDYCENYSFPVSINHPITITTDEKSMIHLGL